jgi:hypothetical protein
MKRAAKKVIQYATNANVVMVVNTHAMTASFERPAPQVAQGF